jgi:DNA-binding XRE family transcriptional regulator
LTQAELATRAGVSRQLVGAVETGRHLPRVDAALALAAALGTDVSELFASDPVVVDVLSGATPTDGSMVRLGSVGDRLVSTPARVGSEGWDVADGVVERGRMVRLGDMWPGVVVAGCEPGLETLERVLRQGGIGALAVATSSAAALDSLRAGRVHAAVVHGPSGGLPGVSDGMSVARFGFASWRVGLALPPGLSSTWWARVLAGELGVIQREEGAAVQRAFEQATVGSEVPGPRTGGHLLAAREAMATGLPAVTIEPAALAVGARFHSLEWHQAELWVDEAWIRDRGVEEMLGVATSAFFRRRLQAVGGYDLDIIGTRVA